MFSKKHTHKGHVHYLQTLKGVISMLRDPYSTESVFDIEDGLKDIEAAELFADHVRELPGVAALIEERYIAPPHPIEELAKLPAGTLGKQFANHIQDHGFDADYFRKIDIKTDTDYVMLRMRQCHDIWHVLTGLGVGPFGELGLKAFELAQTRRPMAAIICTGGVLRYMLKTPEELSPMLNYIAYGYRLGSTAKPFLAAKWEQHWDRPLDEWRAELGANLEEARAQYPLAPDSGGAHADD